MADGSSFNTSRSSLAELVRKTNACADDLEQRVNTLKTTATMQQGAGAYADMYAQVQAQLTKDATQAHDDVETMKALINTAMQTYDQSDVSSSKLFQSMEAGPSGGTGGNPSGLTGRLNNS